MIDTHCVKHSLSSLGSFFANTNLRFVVAFVLSLFAHVILFVYVFSSAFPVLQNASVSTTKPKILSIQLAPKTYPTALAPKQDAAVSKDDIAIKTDAKTEVEEIADDKNNLHAEDAASGSKLSSILNVKYYSLSELDQIPATRNTVDISSLDLLDYPNAGKLSLRLWVDEYGKVVSIESINSELPPDFFEQASKLFMQAEFFPGTINNRPVRFFSKVVVRYVPLNSKSK